MVAKKKKVTEDKENRAKVVVEEMPSSEKTTETIKDNQETPSDNTEVNTDNESAEKLFTDTMPQKSNGKLMKTALTVVLIIFGITGWILYFTNRYSQKTAQEEISLEETATIEPTATPTPQLDRDAITLEILNGSGISGAAGEMAEIFEELGYEEIETGNAEATTGNELYINSEYEDVLDILLEDVEEELDISSISGELEDSDYTARIILGE